MNETPFALCGAILVAVYDGMFLAFRAIATVLGMMLLVSSSLVFVTLCLVLTGRFPWFVRKWF